MSPSGEALAGYKRVAMELGISGPVIAFSGRAVGGRRERPLSFGSELLGDRVKYQLGKLPLPGHPEDFIGPRLLRDGIHGLQVSLQHATRVARLPMIHRDPFDRLLVSQAQIEKTALMSADPIFAQYDVELIRC